MKFVKTTAQRKVAALRKRIRVVQGGTSASKTFTILPILITYAIAKKGLVISVVSETYPHLRKGAIRDFENIMRATGNWNRNQWNASNGFYTFANGSVIEFFSADSEDKLRGARRNILFVNEANNIKFNAYDQMAIRTKDIIFIDFNPSEEFWAHTEVQGEPDVDWITLTYKDNEATPLSLIKEFEKRLEKAKTSAYWQNWCNVYLHGKLGSLEGVIFKEGQTWHQVAAVPAKAELIGYGLDFGYKADPTACIALYRLDGRYYVDEVFYGPMNNGQIIELIKANDLTHIRGVADSAEPKSVDYIGEHGISIEGVQKTRIWFGIDIVLQHGPYYITQRSLNLIKELRTYRYSDKPGKKNEPVPNQEDHAIDAWRYIVTTIEGAIEYSHIVV